MAEKREEMLVDLIEEARACRKQGKLSAYLALLPVIEREEIIPRIKDRIARILGEEIGDRIFSGLPLPPVGAPPSSAVPFTEELVRRLLSLEEEKDGPARPLIARALSGNAHGIPPSAFDREKALFDDAPSLEAYLTECHARSVETLQNHAESGELWFEQIITPEVVELVRANREILGGVLRKEKIYVTKIPYDPAGWLREKDTGRKPYLACHCPMAREALREGGRGIDPLWCACSAGFAGQKFHALFGEEVETEVVSSLFAGDDLCRFAITVPERFL